MLNRTNARSSVIDGDDDYTVFERVLGQAVVRYDMRLLAYCVMPNHFHFVLWPSEDDELSLFLRWLTVTRTPRWHTHDGNAGAGYVYEDPFKSFPVQSDKDFLTVRRFVKQNARRTNLVARRTGSGRPPGAAGDG